MNKKHLISIIAVVLVVAVALAVFTACNKYEWSAIADGDSNAQVESNGGYYVKQGNYAYFINGYDTASTVDNSWGTPVKNGIVRVKVNADGTYDNDSAAVVVPKQIYNKSVNGGFAVYGEWIYYATPNNDKDKNGVASTTHTDFMRTKTNGSQTQLLGTVASRSYEYLFTSNRVLIFNSSASTIYYIDFSGISTDKSSDSPNGVKTGILVENVSNVVWDYNCDYVVYNKKSTDDYSYEFCNSLCAINVNGGEEIVIIDKYTYLTESEKADYVSYFPTKVFCVDLKDGFVESRNSMTLYYVKSNYINSAEESCGLFSSTVTFGTSFDPTAEKHLTNTDPTAIFPIADGKVLATMSDNTVKLLKDGINDDADIVIGKSATVQNVNGDEVYYTDSTGGKLYAISISADGKYKNEATIVAAGITTNWLKVEFVGDRMFFFNSSDYNYLHYADLNAWDGESITDTTFLGIMNDADSKTKADADKTKDVVDDHAGHDHAGHNH